VLLRRAVVRVVIQCGEQLLADYKSKLAKLANHQFTGSHYRFVIRHVWCVRV
jgi:hypothetical protein